MAEPIVVEDLMRILARAAEAVKTGDAQALKEAGWDLQAIERPIDAHGWDTTKVALYAMRLLESIAKPRRIDGPRRFGDVVVEELADLREMQAYFDAKRARAAELDADFGDAE